MFALALYACEDDSANEPAPQPDAGDDGGTDAGDVDGGELPIEPFASLPRGTVEAVAGQTSTGFVDGVGAAARFSGPAGAALSSDGSTIYVADTFNSLIRRVDTATGEVETIAGQVGVGATSDGTGTAATFRSPRAMALSPDDSTLYIADGPTIRTLNTSTLVVSTVAGSTESGYVDDIGDAARMGFLLHSFALSDDGQQLFISDRSNEVLRSMDTMTFEVTTLAGESYPGFESQHADGFDDDVRFSGLGGLRRIGDTLYIVDTFNSCLRTYDIATGEVATIAGDPEVSGNQDGVGAAATFELPQSLTGDATTLYIVGFNGLLREYDIATQAVSTPLGVIGETSPRDGDVDDARLGIAFGPPLFDSAAGTLYYNDRDASSIRAIDTSDYSVATLVGAVEPVGSRDGGADTSRFNGPQSITCNTVGDICWIADTYNHTIREWDRRNETVSTIAGQAGTPGSDDGVGEDALLAAPEHVLFDEENNRLFVSDTANHTIRTLDLVSGELTTLVGNPELPGAADGSFALASFDSPLGLAFDREGQRLFVSDAGNSTIRVVSLGDESVSTLLGDPENSGDEVGDFAEATLRFPAGLALDATSQLLYIVDASFLSGTVKVADLGNEELAILTGEPGESGVADGDFTSTLHDSPSDLALSDDGEYLYVVDGGSGLIRRLDLAAETTVNWVGNPVLQGNPPTGSALPREDATFFFAAAIDVAGDDFVLIAEDALFEVRPDSSWE